MRGHLGIIAMVKGEAIFLDVVGVVCFSSKKSKDESLPMSIQRHFSILGLPLDANEPELQLAT